MNVSGSSPSLHCLRTSLLVPPLENKEGICGLRVPKIDSDSDSDSGRDGVF